MASHSKLPLCKSTWKSTGIGNISYSLGHMKYCLKLISIIRFQFWEPPRGALYWGNLNFLIWTPLENPVLDNQKVARITTETSVELDTQLFRYFWDTSSFVRHPVNTNLASKRATEETFFTKICRI